MEPCFQQWSLSLSCIRENIQRITSTKTHKYHGQTFSFNHRRFHLSTTLYTTTAALYLQLALRYDKGATGLQALHGIIDKLVNNCACGLPLVDNGSGLTHEEGSGILHVLISQVVTLLFEIMLDLGVYMLASGSRITWG